MFQVGIRAAVVAWEVSFFFIFSSLKYTFHHGNPKHIILLHLLTDVCIFLVSSIHCHCTNKFLIMTFELLYHFSEVTFVLICVQFEAPCILL
jgi:hypothetical protein